MHWCNKDEEFSSTLHYIEGPHNILAYNLSRLHRLVTLAQLMEGKNLIDPAVVTNDEDELYLLELNDEEVCEALGCYLNLPEMTHPHHNPLNYTHIHEQQQHDEKLLALQAKYPDNYTNLQLDDDVDYIICYKKDPAQDNWKKGSSSGQLEDYPVQIIGGRNCKWLHQVMGHPGKMQLKQLLRQWYYHPSLRQHI